MGTISRAHLAMGCASRFQRAYAMVFAPDHQKRAPRCAVGKHVSCCLRPFDHVICDIPEGALKAFNKGNDLYRQGKKEEALVEYDEACRLCPEECRFWQNKALVNYDLKRFVDAVHDADVSIVLNYHAYEGYLRKFLVYYETNQYKLAGAALVQVLPWPRTWRRMGGTNAAFCSQVRRVFWAHGAPVAMGHQWPWGTSPYAFVDYLRARWRHISSKVSDALGPRQPQQPLERCETGTCGAIAWGEETP